MHLVPFLLILLASQRSQIPAGTPVEARLESVVRTRTSSVGDRVVAVVVKPVFAADGTVISQGSRLFGRVETLQIATTSSEGRVRLVFREIELSGGRRFQTWITESFAAIPPRRGLRYTLYMGTGGVTGALIGGRAARAAAILGGALLGFIVADNSGGGKLPDLTLKPGHRLHLKFGEDLQMSLSSDRPASFDSSAERRLLRYVRYGDRGVCE